jgi:DNA-binding beta-propeller fold protein YncE
MTHRILAPLALAAFIAFACEQPNSPDISSLPQPGKQPPPGDTTYVLQSPPWGGFNQPEAVIVGNEPFIYVADTENDRIVMLDLGGGVVGVSPPIKHPVALTEDKRLQLLVCAQFDTLLPGRSAPTTFGAVYRLDLVSVMHSIASVTPRRVFFEPGDSSRRYTGVAALYDNSYYLTRVGPKNSLISFDRDNAILQFSKNDSLINSISASSNFAPDGTGLMAIHHLNGIATLPNKTSSEFVYSQIAGSSGIEPLFKVQWIKLVAEGLTQNWQSKFYAYRDGDIDFLRPGFFGNPRGVTLDQSENLFVADADSNAVFRFTSRGTEQFSIAKDPDGNAYFNHPYGVAYFDKTVYVADRGNNRILRFKLSTDR